jgi:hypothetical protein
MHSGIMLLGGGMLWYLFKAHWMLAFACMLGGGAIYAAPQLTTMIVGLLGVPALYYVLKQHWLLTGFSLAAAFVAYTLADDDAKDRLNASVRRLLDSFTASAGVAGENVKTAAYNARDKAEALREKLPEAPGSLMSGGGAGQGISARTETPAGESTGEFRDRADRDAGLRQRPL